MHTAIFTLFFLWRNDKCLKNASSIGGDTPVFKANIFLGSVQKANVDLKKSVRIKLRLKCSWNITFRRKGHVSDKMHINAFKGITRMSGVMFDMFNIFISWKIIPQNLQVIVLKPHICKTNLPDNDVGLKERSEISEVGCRWHISGITLSPRRASKVTPA